MSSPTPSGEDATGTGTTARYSNSDRLEHAADSLRAAVNDNENASEVAEWFRVGFLVEVARLIRIGLEERKQLVTERLALAKLAAPTPQFDNPLHVYAAQEIRDRLLAEEAARARV